MSEKSFQNELVNPQSVFLVAIGDGKIVGYASVRRKPARSKIAECDALYKKLLAEEAKQ